MRTAYADVRDSRTGQALMEAFHLYFASLASITLHPGYEREGTIRPTLEQLADMALEMVKIGEEKCQHG